MSRHSRALQELQQRIQDGEIGDVILLRGYRMHGPVGSAFQTKWPGSPSELLWQIRNFHGFLWASGGCFNDFYIHHVDHLCWMKNAWPVKAQALGGRHYKLNPEGVPYVDQNFDTYSVEYTFADGAKMYHGRALHERLQRHLLQLCAWQPKAWPSPPRPATAARPPASSRARTRSAPTCSGPPRSAPDQAGSLSERVERPDGRHPQRQALQRGPARRGSQPRHAAWAAWPPTPARRLPSRTCSTASTSSRRTWTS